MPQRACGECGEMVDEAKAFCPSCGHAFVEEQKREQPSEFQSMDGTQQFGKTMYNQMLSDMGLNLNAAPKKVEQARAQVLQALPVVTEPRREPAPPTSAPVAEPDNKRRNKFLIFGIIAAFLILVLLVLIAAAILLWLRFG